jgi:urate oxidase
MPIQLLENTYGESHVRLLRLSRQEGRHDIRELSLAVRFEGGFEAAHTRGDNRKILPADTMKNTVYALARQHSIEPLENFGLHLIEHFLTYNAQVSRVIVEASESIWARLPHGGKPHPSAFARAGDEKRTAVLSGTRERTEVRSGVADLLVLKTATSRFEGFKKDPYTTLKDERDLILSTIIKASWLYTEEDAEFGGLWHAVRQMLLETFAEHQSQSAQHTLYTMGEIILQNFENIGEIQLSISGRHFNLVDLSPLGMDNPGTVFLPADEPYSVVEATLRKSV